MHGGIGSGEVSGRAGQIRVRYFQKEWHFAWNDFSDDSYARNLRAVHEQNAAWVEYWKHLEDLRCRISPELFDLLRYSDKAGLPYSRLMEFSVTDYPLGSTATSTGRRRRPRPQAILLLQTEDGRVERRLTFRQISKLTVDFPTDQPFGSYPMLGNGALGEMAFDPERAFGTLYFCELVAIDDQALSFELLLDTGGTILVQFKNVSYKSRTLRR